MPSPSAEDFSVLRLLFVAGNFYAGAFADEAAKERCLEAGWIIPEGETGHALTLEGSCLLLGTRLQPADRALLTRRRTVA